MLTAVWPMKLVPTPKIAGLCALLLLTSSCSNARKSENTEERLSSAASKRVLPDKPLDGWGPFKFGMAFDDALSADPRIRWDAESFQECRDQMPIDGCDLAASDESYVPLTAGVALLPRLGFNQSGELVMIDMTKILRGDIESRQCERVHGQLLDYLDAQWGRSASAKPTGGMLARTTPKGRTFYRTAGSGPVFVFDVEDFSKRADGRKITILSHYTAKSKYSPATCWLSIYYEAPKRLERPPVKAVRPADMSMEPSVSNHDDAPSLDEEPSSATPRTDEYADSENEAL